MIPPDIRMRKYAAALIGVYQATLSPDHGPLRRVYPYGFCRFQPTCSEYGKQKILERGVVIGSLLLAKRLLSCHPWKKPDAKRVMRVVHGDIEKR